jgi:hypothetical protein
MCEMEMSPALSAFGREKDFLMCAGKEAEAMKRSYFLSSLRMKSKSQPSSACRMVSLNSCA